MYQVELLQSVRKCAKNSWNARAHSFRSALSAAASGLVGQSKDCSWFWSVNAKQVCRFSVKGLYVNISPVCKKTQFLTELLISLDIELIVWKGIQRIQDGWRSRRFWSLWMYFQSWNGNEKTVVPFEAIAILLHRRRVSSGIEFYQTFLIFHRNTRFFKEKLQKQCPPLIPVKKSLKLCK